MTDRRRALTTLFTGVVVAAALGCGGEAGGDDATVAAWRKAGLEVSAMTETPAAPYGASACKAGTVSGVDVVLCSFPTDAAAKAAEEAGLGVVGQATGAALAAGSRLLVVADRRKADPTGRTIDAVTRAFRK
ncbi:MAG: hypothetical protein R3B06_32910 [Kofleriaceae bacterium]